MSRIASKLFMGVIQQMIAGLQKHFAGQTIMLAGKPVKVDDVITKLNSFTTQDAATEAARQAWLVQADAQDALQSTQIDPQLVLLHAFVVNQFGATNGALADFGMKPRTTKQRTSAQKAETAQKAAATRTARHTVGPRQKAQIHGAPAPTTPDAPKK